MRIVRAPRRSGFTLVPNATVRDSTISRRARGLLVEILSYPDDWSTTSEDLADGGPEGRDAIRTALSELEGAGYLLRARVVGPGGRWSTVSAVYDTPQPPGSLPPGVERVGGRLRLVPETFDVDAETDAEVPPTPRNPASAEPASAGQALSRKTDDEDPPTPRERGNWCVRHPDGAPPGVSCRACGTDRASRARAARAASSAAASAAAHARAAARTGLGAERDPDLSETWAARVRAENRWTG